MKLIDLLVQELPKCGGWPLGCLFAVKNKKDGYIRFRSDLGDFNSFPFLVFHGSGVVSKDEYEAVLAASNPSEWNGEGLPPVGTRCEWQDKNTKAWLPVIVVYSSEWVTVIKEDKEVDPVELAIENYADEARCKFRPIRTEAERKREDSIAAMRNFATNYNNTAVIHAIEQVYDSIAAGKIPGIKLDGDS